MTEGRADVVWLARHGQREDFVDLDWGLTATRPHDPGLSIEGIGQARAVGAALRGEGVRRIFTSPYLRCAQTAHFIAELVAAPVHVEPGLGELNHPDWTQGKPELLSAHELALLTGAFDMTHVPVHEPTYPETIEHAFARAAKSARAIADGYQGPVLLVGHAVSIIGIVQELTGASGDVECPCGCLLRMARADSMWTMT